MFAELPSTGWVTSPAGVLGAFLQHAQLEIKAQKPNHWADTWMPNALNLKPPDTQEHVPGSPGSREQLVLCNRWAPKPNLSPASGPAQEPGAGLCSSSWLHLLALCFSLCSQLCAHPRRCVLVAVCPPPLSFPRSLPRVRRPSPLVSASCIILYMTSGFRSCSVPTAVFPSVYINLSKHN